MNNRIFFLLAVIISFLSIDFKAQDVAEPVAQEDVQKEPESTRRLFHINSINAVIFGKDDTYVVTTMDISRPNIFEGRQLPEKDFLTRYLIYEDAHSYKIPVDEETVNKYLDKVKKDNNFSDDDVVSMFNESNYTYDEGRFAFKMVQTNSQLINFKILGRLIVSDELVKKYHQEHPEITPEAYQIEIAEAVIPEGRTVDDVRAEIDEFINSGKSPSYLSWQKPFWLNKDEVAQKEIMSLEPGQMIVNPTRYGFDIIRLKDKQEELIKDLDEQRYAEIENTLRQPEFERLLKEYEQELWAKSSLLRPEPAPALRMFDVLGMK